MIIFISICKIKFTCFFTFFIKRKLLENLEFHMWFTLCLLDSVTPDPG